MRAATLVGSGAILLWAFLALLSRAAASIPPFQITAMSFAVSGAVGVAALALRGELGTLRQPPVAWLHGLGGLFGYHALYFAALQRAPAATANLLNYTWPLWIVLLSAVVLRLPLGWRHVAGVGLALAGCAALLGQGAAFPPGAGFGYALAAGSGLVWGAYSVLARRLRRVPVGAVAGFCAGTAVLAGVAHVVTERTVVPSPLEGLAVLALGVGPLGLAFGLWDYGMKRGDPRLLGTIAFATPVLSTILLAAAGEAPFTVVTLAAAVLVAAGGWVASEASGAAED